MAQLKATTIDGNLTVGGTLITKKILLSNLTNNDLIFTNKNVTFTSSDEKHYLDNIYQYVSTSSLTEEGLTFTYYGPSMSSGKIIFPAGCLHGTVSYSSSVSSFRINCKIYQGNSSSGTEKGGVTITAYCSSQSVGGSYNLTITDTASATMSVALYSGYTYHIRFERADATITGYVTGKGIYYTHGASSSGGGTIALGCVNNVVSASTNIGTNAYSTGAKISLGAAGLPVTYITSPSTGWTFVSDQRDKADFKLIDQPLKFINTLSPVTFVDNNRDKYLDPETKEFQQDYYDHQIYKGHRRIAGFIAQDVYKSMQDVYQDDNYASIVDYSKYDEDNPDVMDRYHMRYTQLIPFLTGAIQELSKKVEDLEAKITELEKK